MSAEPEALKEISSTVSGSDFSDVGSSALIVCRSATGAETIAGLLKQLGFDKITIARTAAEAKSVCAVTPFGLCIISDPLPDIAADALAWEIASHGGEVIVIVADARFEEFSDSLSELGVIVISKPFNASIFRSAVRLAESSRKRVSIVQRENERLKQNLEDIKVINRAKLLLVSRLSMSEPEAHKYIEKQAMTLRRTRRAVAEGILKAHEG